MADRSGHTARLISSTSTKVRNKHKGPCLFSPVCTVLGALQVQPLLLPSAMFDCLRLYWYFSCLCNSIWRTINFFSSCHPVLPTVVR